MAVNRTNLHDNDQSELHCMVISKTQDEITPIMCHPKKDMVCLVLSGELLIEYFDDNGIKKGECIYRPYQEYKFNPYITLIKKEQYYRMIALTDVVYVEVNKGPFNKKTHNKFYESKRIKIRNNKDS